MSREKQDKRPSPFCRQGWKLPLIVLTVACMGTFAWALHLVWEHRGDLGGVNYIYALQDSVNGQSAVAPMPGGGAGGPSATTGGGPSAKVPGAGGGAGVVPGAAPQVGVAPQTGAGSSQAGVMAPLARPDRPLAAGPGARPLPVAPTLAGMAQPVAAATPAAAMRGALVSIAGYRDAGGDTAGELVGSGVLIGGEGYVATAAHLIQSWKQLRVRVVTPAGVKEYPARPLKVLAEHNLAVIKLATTEVFPFLSPSERTIMAPGTRVVAWGDDRAGSIIAQAGVVTGTPTTVSVGGRTWQGLIPADGLLYHWAQSGGPLLDDQGRLVGIDMIFKDANGAIRGFFVPAALLRAHFRDVLSFLPDPGGPTGGGPPVNGGGAALNGLGGGSPGAGGFPAPGMQRVAAVVAVPTQGMQGPGAAVPGVQAPGGKGVVAEGAPSTRRPADQWWEQARQKVQQALYLRVADPPFDLNWLGGGDAGHVRSNQIFGYPVAIFLGMLLLGFVSGVSGGMMTMGGGIIKVTGLMAIFGYGIVLVRPVAYITNIFMYGAAALRYKKSGLVDWESVRPMVPWAMAGMVGGYYVGILLDAAVIRLLLGLFALGVGAKMLREIWERRQETSRRRAHGGADLHAGEEIPGSGQGMGAGSGLLGFPMGVVSGILGITGGVVEVPLQRYVNQVSLRVAIANSAILVFFASMVGSVVAMVHGGSTGAFEMSTPLVMAMILLPGAYLGGMLGSWLTTVVPMDVLRWVYAVFMFVIAGRMWTE
ncbi:MAG: TSUP family transporter [Magnetococcales bacterium]|nr:TSUP family transporter [Magnetococcales bacterium]